MLVIILNRIEIALVLILFANVVFTGDKAMDFVEFCALTFALFMVAIGFHYEFKLRRFFAELEERDAL